MVHDIRVRVKEIGDVIGSYFKTTKNSIYIKDALINKATGVTVSMFKIDKKFVLSVSRIGLPSFENFTYPQLREIMALNNEEYSRKANEIVSKMILDQISVKKNEVVPKAETSKPNQQDVNKMKKTKKAWNQLEANEKLFNVTPEFDISEYSTVIDRTSKNYKEIESKSAAIAKEINEQKVTDPHRLEERGIVQESATTDDRIYSDVVGNKWEETNEQVEEQKQKDSVTSLLDEKAKILKDLEELEIDVKSYAEQKIDYKMDVIMKVLARRKAINERLAKVEEALNPKPVEPLNHLIPVSPRRTPSPVGKQSNNLDQKKDERQKNSGNRQNRNDRKNNNKNTDASKSRQSRDPNNPRFKNIKECMNLIDRNYESNSTPKKPTSWGKKYTKEVSNTHLEPINSKIPAERLEEISKNFNKTDRKFNRA